MLEQKMIVGRYLDLTGVPPSPPPPAVLGVFVAGVAQQGYIQESTGIFTKTSNIAWAPGALGPKAHRTFNWLPWVPGGISEVALVGTDVLTGPMSGCWLVTYRKPTGVPYAAHLGTDIASQARTDAVNNAWNAFATNNAASVIGGFNPFRHWVAALPARLASEPAMPPKFFGLYTTANQFFIIVAYQKAATWGILRIAGIQQQPSSLVARLQHVDLPGP